MSFPRYPKYKTSGVEWLGDVPAHWEVRRLSYCERQGASRRYSRRPLNQPSRPNNIRHEPPAASAVPLTEARP